VTDAPLTFEGLLGPLPPDVPNHDGQGRPHIRRTNDGHVVVVYEPRDYAPDAPWKVIYSACPDDCTGVRGLEKHHPQVEVGARLTRHMVGPWPYLNQWGYGETWVLQQIDELQRTVRTHRRTYGEQSAKIGALRAELARARECIRELEAGGNGGSDG
jgi:hypothetical protein